MGKSKYNIEFGRYIDTWLRNLEAEIGQIKSLGRQPVLIAVSRKMPHFFRWILDSYLPQDDSDKWQDLLSECEYTTEHALPFLFKEHTPALPAFAKDPQIADNKPYEVIIIDDTSATGATIEQIVREVRYYAAVKPSVAVVFLSDKSSVVKLREENEYDIVAFDERMLVPDSKIDECLEFVSERNLDTDLPIDMEFPILHDFGCETPIAGFIKDGKYDDAVNKLKEACSTSLTGADNNARSTENLIYHISEEITGYDRSSNAVTESIGKQDSISIVLQDEYYWGYNNDFSKIRIFYRSGRNAVRYVAYCPNVLSFSDFSDAKVFDNSEYARIWETVIGTLQDNNRLYRRTFLSLVVVANYLYSLSCLLRNMRQLMITDNCTLSFNKEDMRLIFGNRLLETIYQQVELILYQNIITTPKKGRYVNISDQVIPEEYADSYRLYASTILFEKWGDEPSKTLDDVFSLSHHKTGILNDEENEIIIPSGKGIYESYTSLHKYLSSLNTDSDLTEKIHRWIDESIDRGMIVPRYCCVNGSDNLIYSRRYFTLGASPAEV